MLIDKIFKYKNIKKGRLFIGGILLNVIVLWGGSYLLYVTRENYDKAWFAFPLFVTFILLFALSLMLIAFNYNAWDDNAER